jgi:hypothetical protein
VRNERSWPTYRPCPRPDERWPAAGWLLIPPDFRRMLYGRSWRTSRKAHRRLLIVQRESRWDAQWTDITARGFGRITPSNLASSWEPPAGRITEAHSTHEDLITGTVRLATEITLHQTRTVVGYSCDLNPHLPRGLYVRARRDVTRQARIRAGLNPDWKPPPTPPQGVKVARVTGDRL